MYVCTCEYVYLNICTYMSPHVKLIYTETPCFGENKRTPKITKNTGKCTLQRATKVTISNFLRTVFLAGVTETNDAHLHSCFARNAAL